jgi:hypothetical protein
MTYAAETASPSKYFETLKSKKGWDTLASSIPQKWLVMSEAYEFLK